MSIQAMTRVLEGRVGDRGRKSTLYAMANYAGPDGRHVYVSLERIAAESECSESTARRDLKQLLKDGWIRLGDQDRVAHIRGDRRPVVYDIAMTEETRLAWKADQDGSGERPVSVTPRDGEPDQGTGSQIDTPSQELTGCQNEAYGVSETPSRGVTAVTPEPYEPFEPEPPHPPASGGRQDDESYYVEFAADEPFDENAYRAQWEAANPPVTSPPCSKPGPTPHANCRGCGTTNRQIAAAGRKAGADAKRRRDLDELQAARDAKAAALAAGRTPATDALLDETRRKLKGTKR